MLLKTEWTGREEPVRYVQDGMIVSSDLFLTSFCRDTIYLSNTLLEEP